MLNLFVDYNGAAITAGESSVTLPAILGVTTGVFAIGFIVMTALFVVARKKR